MRAAPAREGGSVAEAYSAWASGGDSELVAVEAGFRRRLRPPREPRRVFLRGFGCSSEDEPSSATASSVWPRSGSGTWIVATGAAVSAAGSGCCSPAAASPFADAAAAGFFLRPRPPRDPRRVFFFGL